MSLVKEESYYPNGQLSFRFWKKEIKEIVNPEHTYENFYWRFFGVRKYANFISTLKDEFKVQLEFLTELGFEELANDDEFIFEESFKSDSVRLNCRSYHKNGLLKFEYTFENPKGPYLDSGVETFELFYEDAQPKFRFKYEVDEEDGVVGSYHVFYNNGQLKEKGSLSYNDSFLERFTRDGILSERYESDTFFKYHDNEKLHYRITLDGSRKHGPYEIYDRSGELIEKGVYKNDEMQDGPEESYYEDGQIDKKCYYKNGVLDGPYYEGNGYGGARINGYFIDGQRVDAKERIHSI